MEDILKLVVMVTARVTGVEICSLWLIDESEKPVSVRFKATQALTPNMGMAPTGILKFEVKRSISI